MQLLILDILLWNFIPSFATGVALNAVHWFLFAGNAPKRGEPLYALHYNRMFLALACAYVVYAESDLGPNLYSALDISPGPAFDSRKLRTQYLSMSLRFHPDKSTSPASEHMYMLVRQAYEVLSKPTLRAGYDYFRLATAGWLQYHGVTLGMLMLVTLFFNVSTGALGRFVVLMWFAVVEAWLLLSPVDPVPGILPSHTLWEKVTLLRATAMALGSLILHVSPILFGSHQTASPDQTHKLLADLDGLMNVQTSQIRSLAEDTHGPFASMPLGGIVMQDVDRSVLDPARHLRRFAESN
nr:hypothetical protein HK105_000706 [Polyrhizophydium stewartii]